MITSAGQLSAVAADAEHRPLANCTMMPGGEPATSTQRGPRRCFASLYTPSCPALRSMARAIVGTVPDHRALGNRKRSEKQQYDIGFRMEGTKKKRTQRLTYRYSFLPRYSPKS